MLLKERNQLNFWWSHRAEMKDRTSHKLLKTKTKKILKVTRRKRYYLKVAITVLMADLSKENKEKKKEKRK